MEPSQSDANLSDRGYRDFGQWNALEVTQSASAAAVIVKGHGGDFLPETPEDYLEALYRPLDQDWPVRADIDITNICNHDCPFCFSQLDRAMQPKLSMNRRLFQRTVLELVEGGTKSIRFCGGGEPLAHPEAYEMMSATLKEPVHVTLLTNGDLFSEKFQRIFLRNFTCVRFSVDSYDGPSRQITHGTARYSFERLMRNISSFNHARRMSGLLDATNVGASYLLHPQSIGNLYRITESLKEAGVDYVAFRRIVGSRFAVEFDAEQETMIKNELMTAKSLLEDQRFRVFVTTGPLSDPGAVPGRHFAQCMVSRVRVIIEANGSVQMCPRARGEKGWRTLGTIDQNTTFEAIWKSGVRCHQQENAPRRCEDCIDISSNRTLNEIVSSGLARPIKLRRRVI